MAHNCELLTPLLHCSGFAVRVTPPPLAAHFVNVINKRRVMDAIIWAQLLTAEDTAVAGSSDDVQQQKPEQQQEQQRQKDQKQRIEASIETYNKSVFPLIGALTLMDIDLETYKIETCSPDCDVIRCRNAHDTVEIRRRFRDTDYTCSLYHSNKCGYRNNSCKCAKNYHEVTVHPDRFLMHLCYDRTHSGGCVAHRHPCGRAHTG